MAPGGQRRDGAVAGALAAHTSHQNGRRRRQDEERRSSSSTGRRQGVMACRVDRRPVCAEACTNHAMHEPHPLPLPTNGPCLPVYKAVNRPV